MEASGGDVEGIICADVLAMLPRHTSKPPVCNTMHWPMLQVINRHKCSVLVEVTT